MKTTVRIIIQKLNGVNRKLHIVKHTTLDSEINDRYN